MKKHIIHMLVDTISGPRSEEIDLDELPIERIIEMLEVMPGLWSYYDERVAKGLFDKGDQQLMSGETPYSVSAFFLHSDADDLDTAARNVRELTQDIPNRIKLKLIPADTLSMFPMDEVDPHELNDDDLCVEIIAQIMMTRLPKYGRQINPFERLVVLEEEFSRRQSGLTKTIPAHVFDIKTLDPQELEKRANRAIELVKIYNFNSEKGWVLIEFIASTWDDDLLAELAILAFRADFFSHVHEPKILAQMVLDRVNNRRDHY